MALIVYWSKAGNTEKVALAIKEGFEGAGVKVNLKKCEETENLDFFDYDIICARDYDPTIIPDALLS